MARRRRAARRRLRGEAGTAGADAGPAGPGAGQHGHLRVRRRVPVRRAGARRRRCAVRATTSARTSSRASCGSGARVRAHDFADSCVNMNDGVPYWRDVGTIDAYWEANIALTHVVPELNLYDDGLADLDLPGAAAAREVRVRRRRPARHGDRLDRRQRLHHQRLDRAPLAAVLERPRPRLLHDRGFGDPARRRRGPPRGAAGGRWSTSIAGCRRADGRARSRTRTGGAST